MLETKYVKDFSGKLILRNKARRIDGAYYEEGVSCILMPDGFWYRTTTEKILFDWETKTWIFANTAAPMSKGLVDDGSIGLFSFSDKNVKIAYRKDTFIRKVKVDIFNLETPEVSQGLQKSWMKHSARTAEIAESFGFVESIFDGIFYKESDMNSAEKIQAKTPGTPNNERSNTYSMDDDLPGKKKLEDEYKAFEPKISRSILKSAKYIPYSFGLEFESSVGHIPSRLRNQLGVRPLRDGSIAGIEYVTIPLAGAKGLQTIKSLCEQMSKRCNTNNQCSVHVHFGNVRRDKLYIVSLWKLISHLQEELLDIFPYSRLNSIRNDGKVYCKPLDSLKIDGNGLSKCKDQEQFKELLFKEFNKIYAFLNNNHIIGELEREERVKKEKIGVLGGRSVGMWKFAKKMYFYSTKNKTHSIRGNKWDRPQRYYWMNLLPTFFSNAETIEFRPHEATFNFEKTFMWMLICVSILEYAKKTKECLTSNKISLSDVLSNHLPIKAAEHILGYCKLRKQTFKTDRGYRSNWETIENKWLEEDKTFKFNNTSIELFL